MNKYITMRTVFFLFLLASIFIPSVGYALPEGFEVKTVATGLNLPTSIVFAPDGRIFIAEKSGSVRVWKEGVLLETPFLRLQHVNDYADRGLIGIALDPNFAENGWVYLSHTYENNPANYEGPKTGRVVRVKAAGDAADMSTLEVLVGSVGGTPTTPSCEDYEAGADCIPSDEPSHSVGGLRFGPDGKLYATLGDGASFEFPDPLAERAQNLDRLAGKMLRLNPDGSAPADNPFYTGDPTANRSKIWGYGLRNAFRFSFHPTRGIPYLGDVGWFTAEEINEGVGGRNFGWPCREGNNATPGYDCTAIDYVNPWYAYSHDPVTGAGSVTAGVFYEGSAYPAEYAGDYIFGDFAMDFLKRIRVDSSGAVAAVEDFMANPGGPVEIVLGPDENIYYLSIYTGELRKITHTSGNRNPIAKASATPVSGAAPLAVKFSSAESFDPDGDSLAYHWDFGDGASSSEPNPTHAYTANGTYTARLVVEDGKGGAGTASVAIVVGNEKPAAQITNPPHNSTYRPGQIIPLFGKGTDPEDGNLAQSAYAWRIIMHHNTHIHILQTFEGTSNPSFVAPSHDDPNVYIEVELTVTDSGGLQDTASIDLRLAPPPTVEPHHVQTVLDKTNPVTGEQLRITTTVSNTGTEDPLLVDLEIYDASGAKIAQQFYDNEIIPSNTTKDYEMSWTPQAAGNYRVAVGIMHAGWQGLYEWTNEAALFTVSDTAPPPPAALWIYDDALGDGWADWSWETTADFAFRDTAFAGTPPAVKVEFQKGWAGFYLHHDSFDTADATHLEFAISGGASGGQQLQIRALDRATEVLSPRHLSNYLPVVPANSWEQVRIPLADLGVQPGDVITGFIFQDMSGDPGNVYFDSMRLE